MGRSLSLACINRKSFTSLRVRMAALWGGLDDSVDIEASPGSFVAPLLRMTLLSLLPLSFVANPLLLLLEGLRYCRFG